MANGHGGRIADPTGDDRLLAPDTAELLRSVWSRATSGATLSRAELREIACRVSASAHAENLLPEQVIRGVKESWRGFTGFRTAGERDAQEALLADLISQCIREFYRADGDGPGAAADGAPRPRAIGVVPPRQERTSREVRWWTSSRRRGSCTHRRRRRCAWKPRHPSGTRRTRRRISAELIEASPLGRRLVRRTPH